MKRLAAIACLAAGLALPVCAQHGGGSHGGGGGFGGHSAPSFHGGGGFNRGFRAPARSFSAPRYASRPQTMARNRYPYGAPGMNRGFRPNYGNRPGGFRRDDHRRAYISPYWPTYSYGYPWIWPGYPTVLDYGDDYDSDYGPVADYGDDGNQGPDNQGYGPGDQNYGPGYGPDYGPVQPPPPSWPSFGPYAPQSGTAQASAAPSTEEAVTLVFKDGRPPETIHNYVLTPTTLYAGDIVHRQVIPLDQLDLPATEKANSDAGVEFHVPRLEVRTVPNPGQPDTHVLSNQ